MHIFCSICQQRIVGFHPSSTDCGHVFHSDCINAWGKFSKSCPQCRSSIKSIVKLFLEYRMEECDEGASNHYAASLKEEIEKYYVDLNQSELNTRTMNEKLEKEATRNCKLRETNAKITEQVNELEEKLRKVEFNLDMSHIVMEKYKADHLEVEELKKKLDYYQKFESLLESSENDAQDMLKSVTAKNSKDAVQQLSTYLAALKREYDRLASQSQKMAKLKYVKRNAHSIYDIDSETEPLCDDLLRKVSTLYTEVNPPLAVSIKRSINENACRSPDINLKKGLKRNPSMVRQILDVQKHEEREISSKSIYKYDDIFSSDVQITSSAQDAALKNFDML